MPSSTRRSLMADLARDAGGDGASFPVPARRRRLPAPELPALLRWELLYDVGGQLTYVQHCWATAEAWDAWAASGRLQSGWSAHRVGAYVVATRLHF